MRGIWLKTIPNKYRIAKDWQQYHNILNTQITCAHTKTEKKIKSRSHHTRRDQKAQTSKISFAKYTHEHGLIGAQFKTHHLQEGKGRLKIQTFMLLEERNSVLRFQKTWNCKCTQMGSPVATTLPRTSGISILAAISPKSAKKIRN